MKWNKIFDKHIDVYRFIVTEETEAKETPVIIGGVRHFQEG